MNWEAIGAVGEIIGASAVVISLVYLGTQIRNQNRETRAASVHQVLDGYRQSISVLMQPEMAAVWVKGHQSFESLEPDERLRFLIYLTATLKNFEDGYFQWRERRLDDRIWQELLAPLLDVMGTTAFDHFWEMRRHHFRKEFAAYIDTLDPRSYQF